MTDLFTQATSYRIEGCERYETPETCIVEWAQDSSGWIQNGHFDEVSLLAMGSVTVHAYVVCERQQLDFDNLSDDVMLNFEDAYSAANLNLTDDIDRLMHPDIYRVCKAKIRDALEAFAATLPVTKVTDKPVASRTYSADEVLAVLREVKPGWFRELGT